MQAMWPAIPTTLKKAIGQIQLAATELLGK